MENLLKKEKIFIKYPQTWKMFSKNIVQKPVCDYLKV